MKGDPAVVETLRAAMPMEAHLNLQYRANRRVLKFMGIKKTAGKMDEYADDGHRWLKAVTKQLLNLGGSADYSVAPIAQSATLTVMLSEALKMETSICSVYERNIQVAMKALDDMTRNLFEHLIKWHRGHQFWIERQLRLIQSLGEENYIEEKL